MVQVVSGRCGYLYPIQPPATALGAGPRPWVSATHVRDLAPGFHQAQPWLLQAIWTVNQQTDLCHSASQIHFFFFSKFTMLPISSVFYFSSLYMMPSKLTHHKNGGVENDCIWFMWGLRLVLMVFLSLWMLEEVHDQSNPIGACILCHLQVGHLLSFHCWTEWGLWEQARLPPRRSWGLSERVTTTDTFHTPGAPKEKWSQGLGLGGNELSSL